MISHNTHHIQTLKALIKTPFFKTPISNVHNSRKPTQFSNPAIDFILNEVEDLQSSKPQLENTPFQDPPGRESVSKEKPCVEISHQWPEWVEFMEHLLKKGYFDEVGKGELGGKDANRIRTACLNFGRHRFDVIR